ncbi:ORC2 [[Candida] subhashii]|uniref:ORC2 n=1 Tax=[Candida] subhashii TaxID=561895 RepID=A0A8J5QHQ2_9ASCO|nr:ORC2 [[Candida] subhashii]KAG7664836.1 ORC2 [[Candida] subhashii]
MTNHQNSPTRSGSMTHMLPSPNRTNKIPTSPNKLPFNGLKHLLLTVRSPSGSGRAGLPSPEKRPSSELDKSARKRAINTSNLYRRSMDDDDEGDQDGILDRQERELAERIIRESRGEVVAAEEDEDDDESEIERYYGSDVEFEEDLTERKAKRTRTKAVKKTTYVETDSEIESSPSEEFTDESDMEEQESSRPKRKARTRIVDSSPTRRKQKREKRPRKEPEDHKRRGRPPRTELIASQVKSIFQQDDEEFASDTVPSYKLNRRDDASPKQKQIVASNFVNALWEKSSTINTVPIVSGIKKKPSELSDDQPTKLKFEPLPIPRMDSEGNIVDQEYLDKYFDGIDFTKCTEGRFLDDRAFFLEGSEGYFEQHQFRSKAKANSLGDAAPGSIDYQDFNSYIKLNNSFAQEQKNTLKDLHKYLYNQWCFELTQGFNLNFYGIGSKLDILNDFIQEYFGIWYEDVLPNDPMPKVLVVNGYNPTISLKKLILEIASCLIPKDKKVKLPKHLSGTVPFLINYMKESREEVHDQGFIKPKLVLVIHSFDGDLFRDEKAQNLLIQLCGLPEVWLLSSTDNLNVGLLWDSFKSKNLNFIWHDLTTYASYTTEMSFKDVLSLGRSKKFVGETGAKFVLRSLTDNHRNLYRILLQSQIQTMTKLVATKAARTGLKGSSKYGIQLKELYELCLDEFITSNEITFRTLLTEYIEHKMCQLVKDSSGVEIVFIPFSFDEMERLNQEEFVPKA